MPGGRKGIYADWLTEDSLKTIRGWARDKLTDKEIAKLIGICPQTFAEWKSKFPELADAVKKGRAPVIIEIEDNFYSRCEWRKVEETKEEVFRSSDGRETKKLSKVTKWIPPDTGAMIFALKNLKPKAWREKPEPISDDTTEDDGLISALTGQTEKLFQDGDDAAFLKKENETG